MAGLCAAGGAFGDIGGRAFQAGHVTIPAGPFVLLFAATWISGLALFILFPRFPDTRRSAVTLMALALVFRVLLLPHPPSDDIYRYLWEGRLIREGVSPYAMAPDDPALAALAAGDPFHAKINHPDMPAIYPPFVLMIFGLVGRLGYDVPTLKLLFTAADLGTVWGLLLLLMHRGLPLRWVALYAFNPVVLYGFAGQGHLDAVQNLFLVWAVAASDRRRWGVMFLLAGLAVQSKYVAVLALPFFLRRDNWPWVWAAFLAILLPVLPFRNDGLFDSLMRFGGEFAFNGSIHALLRWLPGGIAPATAVCKAVLAAALVAGIVWFHPLFNRRYRDDPVPGIAFAMAALLALSPTVHYWYLSWILLWMPVRPAVSWMVASLTVTGYFTTYGIAHATGRWHLPTPVQIMEWLPVWLLLMREMVLFARRMRTPAPTKPVNGISVVIPALNESERIGPCVRAVRSDPAVVEVIVADAGSSDDTAIQAETAGAVVIRHDKPVDDGGGRGGQIFAGVKWATCDVVAVVHADTLAVAPVFSDIRRLLDRLPEVVGGASGGIFEGPGTRLRL
ncbi:MAG TPA: glycosyltransferase, partial [Desulfosarcina sp.]|nr:glycosyltransferase [Desulfosarcina sp.]